MPSERQSVATSRRPLGLAEQLDLLLALVGRELAGDDVDGHALEAVPRGGAPR